jgi:hypothetical protein
MAATAETTRHSLVRQDDTSAWRWALRLHAGYLALFTVWTALVSSVFPKFVEEARVPIWPSSAPLGTWLERVVLLPLYRYDVIWYVGIAEHGYGHRPGDTAFHPLYPLLMGLVGRALGGQYLLAGWLISQVCCVAMLALLYRLVMLDHDADTARRTTVFLIGSPLGFAFLLPYTESLLLLGIVGAIYAARQGHWWLAGLAGAAAALTKQPGAVVLLPALWELWQQRRTAGAAGAGGSLVRPLAGLALTPLGLAAWLVYRATLGDVSFDWSRPETLVGALLVTPTYQDVWGEYFSWPWVNFGYALEQLRERPYFYLLINFFVMLIMLVLALFSLLRQRSSYRIYSLALVLMNLSIVYPLWPYMGIIRRFTIVFPMFIELARWGRRPLVTAVVLVLNALIWTFVSAAYVRNAFVP